MFSRSLLLVLLVLACLQSITTAESENGPTQCCVRFQAKQIPVRVITAYHKTELQCPKPGVIFTLKNGHQLCADPEVQWVKNLMDKIDIKQNKSTACWSKLLMQKATSGNEESLASSPSAVMISCFLLLVLTCLQSFTMANNARGPEECCFTFAKYPIPVAVIKDYRETRYDCTYPGVIFSFFNGRRVCANPSLAWVKRTMKKIERRLYENSTRPATTL
ncbi:C-C motif chemokine 23-like [Hemibagrus wyckioides]|uniref:C-C motif chemokine 23-like n=1 Tax=Hemibagrus wyckioides TaxID=337641 RepID=UPI00266BDCB7|nr:C-C motif chemokine 23-like [Hemibagrus wyckioides]